MLLRALASADAAGQLADDCGHAASVSQVFQPIAAPDP